MEIGLNLHTPTAYLYYTSGPVNQLAQGSGYILFWYLFYDIWCKTTFINIYFYKHIMQFQEK